jgi:hypothetical protein
MLVQYACMGGEIAEKTIELQGWDDLLRNEQRRNAAIAYGTRHECPGIRQLARNCVNARQGYRMLKTQR